MRKILLGCLFLGLLVIVSACGSQNASTNAQNPQVISKYSKGAAEDPNNDFEAIFFAGGCFWGVEEFFHASPGYMK